MLNKPCHVEVVPKKGESQEKLIRRFFKKCKKSEVVKEYLEKTSYYKSEKTKRKEKFIKNEWLRKKDSDYFDEF